MEIRRRVLGHFLAALFLLSTSVICASAQTTAFTYQGLLSTNGVAANGNFDLPLMFAALTVLSLIGVLLFAAVDLVERLMIPWHASHRTEFRATA